MADGAPGAVNLQPYPCGYRPCVRNLIISRPQREDARVKHSHRAPQSSCPTVRRRLTGKCYAAAAAAVLAFLGGTGLTKAIEYYDRQLATLSNGGDHSPLYLSGDFTAGRLNRLSIGEAIAVADGNDFAMARADSVELRLVEKIPVYRTGKNVQLNARAIDLDGDGKPDLNPLSDEGANFEEFKLVKGNDNKFGKSLSVEVAAGTEMRSVRSTATFVLVFVNAGKKVFSGDLTLLDRLDGRLSLAGPVQIMGAVDQRQGNAMMSMIPYLNLFTANNADFKWEERFSAGIFGAGRGTSKVEDGVLQVKIPSVTIKPRQGVAVIFDATVDWSKPAI